MGNLQSEQEAPRRRESEKMESLDNATLQADIFSQSGCSLDTTDKRVYDLIRSRERKGGWSPRSKVHVAQRYLPVTGDILKQTRSRIFCGKFSRDGSVYMSANQDRQIRFFNTTSWKETKNVHATDVGWSVIDADYSPDGKWLIYSGWCDSVNLVNVVGEHSVHEHMQINQEMGHWCLFSVKFSSDSNEVLGGSNDTQLHLYDLNRREIIFQIPAHQNDINTVAYAEDGNNNLMLSGSDDCLIKIWDRRQVDSGRRQASGVMIGHSHGITHISPKGDGRFFISNGKDQAIKLWDLRMMADPKKGENTWSRRAYDYRYGAPQPTINPHDSSIMTYSDHSVSKTLIRCYFSPTATTGQKYIYTGSSDGVIYVYDILTGLTVAQLEGHESLVRDVSWHPEKDMLLSTSWDGTIRKWQHGEPKPRAQSQVDDDEVPQHIRRAMRSVLDFM